MESLLKKFIKLNKIMDTMMKNMEHMELNGSGILNTQTLS